MLRLSDFDYELPESLVAQTPLEERTASRLLWMHRKTGQVEHRLFTDLADILDQGDLVVFNDTRVSAVRLYGRKSTGAAVEALLLRPITGTRYLALVKPGRRLKSGAEVDFGNDLRATVIESPQDGIQILEFQSIPDLKARIVEFGEVPLPPYIRDRLSDPERYQTVFASQEGSAAAPTAALHFTSSFVDRLQRKGIQTARVTLDVGIDTFRPLQTENLEEHKMHGEKCSVPPETAEAVSACKGKILAIGTTSMRTLETFATDRRTLETGTRTSTLFIRPGYNFKIADGILTNFHLPRTTMLVMLAALSDRERVMAAYEAAISEKYRLLSFGDSMLIL